VRVGGFDLDWGAVLIVGIVTTLLALGTKLSSNVSAVITLIKVAVVLVVIVVGAFFIKMANYTPFIPPSKEGGGAGDQSLFSLLTGAGSSNYGWYGLLAGASIVFFAFIGFDVVATTAEET
jgi:basic amino acid/polyamine antiporter, APA family